MKKPVLVVLGVVTASAVVLTVGRGGESVDSITPSSEPIEVETRGADDLDSLRRIREVVLKRIANSDTYLGFGLAEDDSILRRWEDRTVRMLSFHVSADPDVNSKEDLEEAVRRAFSRWERVGAIPVSFRAMRDSALAEVQVRWIRSFPMARSGQAEVYWDGDGWIRKSTLTLATHDHHGRPTSPDALYAVALHEIGHLLGLGHSDDPEDLMYPITSVNDLTPRDRRTARLLYVLPPGSVRVP